MAERALVANAADREQVREAGNKERRARMREMDDVKAILDLPQGRRFMWRLLEHCSVHASVFAGNDAMTNHLSGKQDVGHFVLGEIVEARPQAYVDMMLENQKEKET